jgi:exodeoxyribonuclease VII large subunit
VGTIEYAGEGELKRAYDALYRKLELAGAFATQQKRPMPEFVERIALITSREGAAIGDFNMNLVRAGLSVDFYPTLVEGKRAVFEVLEAIRYFNQRSERYDVLVIIRGGGSLESLQAFNTEALVEAVRKSKIPVLAGIGHERDVSLVALAADRMVSTPTAAARALSLSWDEARVRVGQYTLILERSVQQFQLMLATTIRHAEEVVRSALESLSHRVLMSDGAFRNAVHRFPEQCRMIRMKLANDSATWQVHLRGSLKQCRERLVTLEDRLRQFDPVCVLRLGYAIARKAGRLVRGATDGIAVGDRIDIQLGQGRLESEVIEITEHV